jgi:hypothetical protein
MRTFPAGPSPLQITTELLTELGLLFNSPAGGKLPNGNLDTGWNCYAKAFVTVFLARLQGIAADYCEGRAYAVSRRPETGPDYAIEPHAWAGLREGWVIDLAGADVHDHTHYTVGHRRLPGMASPTLVSVENMPDLLRLMAARPKLATGNYVIFMEESRRPFSFFDLRTPQRRIKSLPTRQLLERFGPKSDILSKAILHLHRLRRGERPPLTARDQASAWQELAAWTVNATRELEVVWRLAWLGRASPHGPSVQVPPWTDFLVE